MATVTITTDTVELFSHEMYFEFVLDDTSTASYDARLLDIGKLKYSFDIPNSGQDTTSVGIKAGAMDVNLENFLISSSSKLIDVLASSYDFLQQIWVGKMYFKTKGGSYGNPVFFEFTQNDVDYSKKSEKVTLSLQPKTASGYTVKELGELMEPEVSVYRVDGLLATDDDGVLVKEYILHYLYQTYVENPTYPMSVTPIFSSGVFTATGNPTSGDEYYVVIRTFLGVDEADLSSIMISSDRLVGLLSALEGTIYGGALGNPFYISRSDTSNAVTLDTDNIEEIKQEYFYNAKYRELIVTLDYIDENTDPQQWDVTVESNNEFAEKDLNIRFSQNFFGFMTINSSTTATQINVDDSIIQQGGINYPLAFSFDANKKASVTYWGIDGIYPYSTINFDVNAPAVFQGRNFRIKSIEYDFKMDKADMEIYEI